MFFHITHSCSRSALYSCTRN